MEIQKISIPLPMLLLNQAFTSLERKVIYFALCQISQGLGIKEEDYEKGYKMSISNKDLDYDNWSRFLRKLMKLRTKGIDNVHNEKYEGSNWVQTIKAERGGALSIHFTAPATQLLMELNKGYARFTLSILMSLPTEYSQRMFELSHHILKTNRKKHYTWIELSTVLGVPSSYNTTRLKERILDKVMKIFKEGESDIVYTYEIKSGRNEKGNLCEIGAFINPVLKEKPKKITIQNDKILDDRQSKADEYLRDYLISDVDLRNEILFDYDLYMKFWKWHSDYRKGFFKDIRDNGDVAGKLLIHLGLRKQKNRNPNQMEIL